MIANDAPRKPDLDLFNVAPLHRAQSRERTGPFIAVKSPHRSGTPVGIKGRLHVPLARSWVRAKDIVPAVTAPGCDCFVRHRLGQRHDGRFENLGSDAYRRTAD